MAIWNFQIGFNLVIFIVSIIIFASSGTCNCSAAIRLKRAQWVSKQEMEVNWRWNSSGSVRGIVQIVAVPKDQTSSTVISTIQGNHQSILLDNLNYMLTYNISTNVVIDKEIIASDFKIVPQPNLKIFEIEPSVLFSSGNVVNNCSVFTFECNPININSKHEDDEITSLAVNIRGQTIFMAYKSGSVYEYIESLGEYRWLFTEQNVIRRLRYDWLNHHLYFMTATELRRWEGDGTKPTPLAKLSDHVLSFDIDPIRGYLFLLTKGSRDNNTIYLDQRILPDLQFTYRLKLKPVATNSFISDLQNPGMVVDSKSSSLYILQKNGIKVLDYKQNITDKEFLTFNKALSPISLKSVPNDLLIVSPKYLFLLFDGVVSLLEKVGDKNLQLHNMLDYTGRSMAVFTLFTQPWPESPSAPKNVRAMFGENNVMVTWEAPDLPFINNASAWNRWIYHIQLKPESKKKFLPNERRLVSVSGMNSTRISRLDRNTCYTLSLSTSKSQTIVIKGCTSDDSSFKYAVLTEDHLLIKQNSNNVLQPVTQITTKFHSTPIQIETNRKSFWVLLKDGSLWTLNQTRSDNNWSQIPDVEATSFAVEFFTNTLYFIGRSKWIFKLSPGSTSPQFFYSTEATYLLIDSRNALIYWSTEKSIFRRALIGSGPSNQIFQLTTKGSISAISMNPDCSMLYAIILLSPTSTTGELKRFLVSIHSKSQEMEFSRTLSPFYKSSEFHIVSNDIIAWSNFGGIMAANILGNSSGYFYESKQLKTFFIYPQKSLPHKAVIPEQIRAEDVRLTPDPSIVYSRHAVINYKDFYIVWTKQKSSNPETWFHVQLKYKSMMNPTVFSEKLNKSSNSWMKVENVVPESILHVTITPTTRWTQLTSLQLNLTAPTKVPNPPIITFFYHQVIPDPRYNDQDLLEGKICWKHSPENDPSYPVTEYRLTIENRETISLPPNTSCTTFQMVSFNMTHRPGEVFVSLFPCRLNRCNMSADYSQPINRVLQINSFVSTRQMLLTIQLNSPNRSATFWKSEDVCKIILAHGNISRNIFVTECFNSTVFTHWRFDWMEKQLFFIRSDEESDEIEVLQLLLPDNLENSSQIIRPNTWLTINDKMNFDKFYLMSVERLLVWSLLDGDVSIESQFVVSHSASSFKLRSMHLDLGPLWSSSVGNLLKCHQLISVPSEVKKCGINPDQRGSFPIPTVYAQIPQYKLVSFAKNKTFCRIDDLDILKRDEFISVNDVAWNFIDSCSTLLLSHLRPPLTLWVAMSITPLSTPTTSSAHPAPTVTQNHIWLEVPGEENVSYRPLGSDLTKRPSFSNKKCFNNTDFVIHSCEKGEAFISWRAPVEGGIIKHSFKFKSADSQWKSLITGHYEMTQAGKVYGVLLRNLKAGRVYEFGLNLLPANSPHKQFPLSNDSSCICETSAGTPDPPSEIKSKYRTDHEFVISWTPGSDNGSPISEYIVSTKQFINSSTSEAPTSDKKTNWKTFGSSQTAESVISLPSGRPHWVRVEAVNSVGRSKPSDPFLVRPVGSNELQAQGSTDMIAQPYPFIFLPLLYSLFAVLLISLLICGVYYLRKKKYHDGQKSLLIGIRGPGDVVNCIELQAIAPLWNQEVNSLYGIDPPDLDSIERVPRIPANNLRFLRYIGCGAFGKVWEGWLKPMEGEDKKYEKVALKVRNSKSLTEEEFKREAILMYKYQHPNIVRLIGVSFDSLTQQCLVLELMELGNLREYLHKARLRSQRSISAHMGMNVAAAGRNSMLDRNSTAGNNKHHDVTASTFINTGQSSGTAPPVSPISTSTGQQYSYEATLDIPSLMLILRDIVRGCKYLEDQHFVHRDIAARNCLVSHRDPSGRIIKLSDFGLARDIYKNDYYRKTNEPKLPVRWMSPEAIRDGLFTSKSDVWSFAVTCWEVMTLGADPYYGSLNMDVMNMVLEGQVLEKPENCPPQLYDLLLQCWSHLPDGRPTFFNLDSTIEEFCESSKNSESAFSKPFVQSFPIDASLRAAGYEGNISTPNTEQTVLTSGETGMIQGEANGSTARKQGGGGLEHFSFDDKANNLGPSQYLKLNSGLLPSTLKEESESSSAGTTPNLYLTPEGVSSRVQQFMYSTDEQTEGYIEPGSLILDDNYQDPSN